MSASAAYLDAIATANAVMADAANAMGFTVARF
jgi:hypothetical protein